MEKNNWSDVGNNISEMVQKSIDSGDYSKLSQSIRTAVQAQNPWKGNGQFERKTVSYMGAKDIPETALYSNSGATRAKGYVLTFLGGFGCFGFGMAMLIIALTGHFLGEGTALVMGIPLGILFPLFLISAYALNRGLTALGRIRRFKHYIRVLGRRTCIGVSELAESVGKKESRLIKDIRKMIELGMFQQGHMDRNGKNLFVTDQSYEAYMQTKQMEERQDTLEQQKAIERNAYKNNSALSEEVKHLIAEGQSYIEKIRQANDAIKDEAVSAKLDGLELVVTKIFKYVEENPQSAPETKKLMKYYLPTMIKLLDSYQKLADQPVQGPNIQKSKKQIETTLDTLNQAFARLFDNLYQDDSMDIHSDISVLNTLLAQEGLTGEKI